jgi:tripartite-type tricarboxylate transporter receptor subunit TctC
LAPVLAQGYPNAPVKILCGSAPGGPTDVAARLASRWLSERLGQPFIVENRVGANGQIAIQLLTKSKPDGYTLAAIPRGALTVAPAVQKSARYNPLADFTPVAIIGGFPYVLVSRNDFPANDVAGLIAYAKKNPGKVTYGSAGTGSSNHLAGELFAKEAGVSLSHVPYKGDTPGATDLIAGLIDVYFMTPSVAMPQVQAGKIKALGVASTAPTQLAPGVTKLVAAAVPGFEMSSWIGLLGPAGMSPEMIAKINHVINEESVRPANKPAMLTIGQDPVIVTPAAFRAKIEQDMTRFSALAREAHIELD